MKTFIQLCIVSLSYLLAGQVRSEEVPVVVMFGDSTTDGGLAPAVKKKLDELIRDPALQPKVVNAGKGGDNATSALERLEKDVLRHRPDIVAVSFGLNDTGGRKPNQFKESPEKMVTIIMKANIQVVLMTSTPFNNEKHGWGKQFEELGGLDEYMNKEFCEKVRSVSKERAVPLCDLHRIFREGIKKDAGLINKVISGDGVHLTAEGYVLMSSHIAPILQKMIESGETE